MNALERERARTHARECVRTNGHLNRVWLRLHKFLEYSLHVLDAVEEAIFVENAMVNDNIEKPVIHSVEEPPHAGA